MLSIRPRRRWSRLVPAAAALLILLYLYSFRELNYRSWTLFSIPLTWPRGSSRFIISHEHDEFDVSFSNYSVTQSIAGPGFEDRVPPILHHIVLGAASQEKSQGWNDARQACLDLHPGWETHLWTNENADHFVAEKFPELKEMWDNYRYPIQKVDALRYMVLHEYGGAVLDMDLRCRRSLGPLRRFGFVAVSAFPNGFSNGFMMAEKFSPFVKSILQNLPAYNRHWLFLPYTTVMFSTGCHFASVIHTLQPNRTDYKILRGPPDNINMHRLHGKVTTPLFDHLGSSSWHSWDGLIIITLGRHLAWIFPVLLIVATFISVPLVLRYRRRRRRGLLYERANSSDWKEIDLDPENKF